MSYHFYFGVVKQRVVTSDEVVDVIRKEVVHVIQKDLLPMLTGIFSQLNTISMNQQELLAGLNAANDQLKKIFGESKTSLEKLTALENAMSNSMQVTPEVQAAFEGLKAQLQLVDDLIPDAPAANDGGSENTGNENTGNGESGDGTGSENTGSEGSENTENTGSEGSGTEGSENTGNVADDPNAQPGEEGTGENLTQS